MSCDGNRNKYFAHVCAPGSAAAAAFGGQAEAQAALEQIFATARSQPVTDQQLPRLAEISTRALFAQMQAAQLKPPTHSASGLPRADAQRGYHVVYQTLEALKRGQTLPPLARQVQAARQEQRTIDARGLNAIGRLHCTSCGQFVKPQGDHLCRVSATAEAVGRALTRRLRVPPTAYPAGVLTKLLEQAKQGPVWMTHGVTGEPVAVTLDGLPQALRAREEGNKLFVALSDGSLGDHQEAVAILKDARRNGVVTFGIFLGTRAPTQQMDELYGPGNWVQINDIKDFPVSVGRRISQIFKQLR